MGLTGGRVGEGASFCGASASGAPPITPEVLPLEPIEPVVAPASDGTRPVVIVRPGMKPIGWVHDLRPGERYVCLAVNPPLFFVV